MTDTELAEPSLEAAEEPAVPARRRFSLVALAEVVAVLASPAIAYFVLRLRPMLTFKISDPALQTAYVFHPADFYARYQAFLQPTDGLREAARVGFIVPARLAFLAFGALPGFFVTRYVFALIAIVPTYILLRRLYGAAAGVIGIVVIMSCPVIVTAWGSDYATSAADSYLIGALACIAMPCGQRRRPVWLAVGTVLLTMAAWSHVEAVPLAGVALVCYVGVWLVQDPRRVPRDLAVIVGAVIVATGLLSVASELLVGHFDFIRPTWEALHYYGAPGYSSRGHSTNWRFVTYLSYLLVPPAVVAAWAVTFAGRFRADLTSQTLVGLVCIGDVIAFCVMEFRIGSPVLENFYNSNALWAPTCVVLAVTISELARPLLGRAALKWVAAGIVLAVPLLYEIGPDVPKFGWAPAGFALVAVVVLAAAAGRLLLTARVTKAVLVGTSLCLVVVTGSLLVITVAPAHHDALKGVLAHPSPYYAGALGGSPGVAVEAYQISSEIPGFVGNAAYPGELLFTWWSFDYLPQLLPSSGLYHGPRTSLDSLPPHLSARNMRSLHDDRPAELLVLTTQTVPTNALLTALAKYRPVLVRSRVLRSGSLTVHAWLISLGVFAKHAGAAAGLPT